MNERTRKTFAAAGIDPDVLTAIPGTSIHKFMVHADAWLDESNNVLMFVGHLGSDVAKFLYYIGEEHNRDVIGTGPGIVAYQLDEERAAWLRDRVGQ